MYIRTIQCTYVQYTYIVRRTIQCTYVQYTHIVRRTLHHMGRRSVMYYETLGFILIQVNLVVFLEVKWIRCSIEQWSILYRANPIWIVSNEGILMRL